MRKFYAYLHSKIFFISTYKLFHVLPLAHFKIAPSNATNWIQNWIGADLLLVSYTTCIHMRMS